MENYECCECWHKIKKGAKFCANCWAKLLRKNNKESNEKTKSTWKILNIITKSYNNLRQNPENFKIWNHSYKITSYNHLENAIDTLILWILILFTSHFIIGWIIISIICIIISWLLFWNWINKKNMYLTFDKKWINWYISYLPNNSFLWLFLNKNIDINYKDIDIIRIKKIKSWIIYIVFIWILYCIVSLNCDNTIKLIILLLAIGIIIIPLLLREKKYCQIRITTYSWSIIETPIIIWSKKDIFQTINEHLENLWNKNISLLYYT